VTDLAQLRWPKDKDAIVAELLRRWPPPPLSHDQVKIIVAAFRSHAMDAERGAAQSRDRGRRETTPATVTSSSDRPGKNDRPKRTPAVRRGRGSTR
jgi:hypothetical protein